MVLKLPGQAQERVTEQAPRERRSLGCRVAQRDRPGAGG